MDPGTVAHIHLLVNHVPTVGAVIGLSLFVLSFVWDNDGLMRVGLELFVFMALITLVTFATGVAAQPVLKGRAGVSAAAIVRHEDAALMAFVAVQLTGFFSWLALWQSRRLSRPTRATIAAVLLLSVATLLSMTRAAYLGGEIHHPEILSSEEPAGGGDAAAGDAWLTTDAVHRFVAENKWVWPACETLHFVGLSLMFGILALVNLRMLGVMKAVPFAAVHRLLPWAVLGFVVNTVTGMLFLIGSPQQYIDNMAFYWKLAFMMVAGANLLCITELRQTWLLQPGDEPSVTAKALGVSSMFLWAGVMYWGRMLAFLGKAF